MNSETEGLLNTGNNLENVNKPPRNWRYMLEPGKIRHYQPCYQQIFI